MAMFLAGIGWVKEGPVGNRLRWTVDPEEVTASGRFRGLPDEVVLERSPLDVPLETFFPDSATFSIPVSWWQALGDLVGVGGLPTRVVLPQQVQAVSFIYAGPDTFLRVWDQLGDDRALVVEREVTTGELVLLEANLIQELEFFTGVANLQQVAILDLFDHDLAAGLGFETIARVSPRAKHVSRDRLPAIRPRSDA